ncbi:MAG TPA: GNAT family N-acetyltransferase [Nocardiopsis listeri]|uniref:GNAT family N-acetyltransferase n=1 Tax=Nocardiopsis listeri TaxID=53440 RepID=UPI001D84D370|nr:GNAT family N-acetyltransferase [Nocardiopsis listeri]HJE58221.1 GNAT family N-acetyltransferase [Nocardiopsis listeri]
MALNKVSPGDTRALAGFLQVVDLTLSGLDSPAVRLWVEHGDDGRIIGSTGYEIGTDREHALIRSVAVDPSWRSAGKGSDLARFAFERAAEEGAHTAWLFSRRSGPFWRSLGCTPADRNELANVLRETHQVRLFKETGRLDREVAWSRPLT